ncbi:MAG: hypothetical protein JO269_13785 [Burkholderiaceae bacterium]|nr:hypothetical protein [Burkholderiaceae bacterium]
MAPVLALAAWPIAVSAQGESAHTVRSTEVHADSQSDAATVATVPEKSALEVLQRRGAWTQVKVAGGQTGWVRMLNLRFDTVSAAGAANAGNAGKPLSGLTGLLAAGRTSNSGTDTTGVRGLNDEDLKNAQANPAELQKVLKLTTDKSVAQAFAQRSKLTAAKVPYLPDPAPTRN